VTAAEENLYGYPLLDMIKLKK